MRFYGLFCMQITETDHNNAFSITLNSIRTAQLQTFFFWRIEYLKKYEIYIIGLIHRTFVGENGRILHIIVIFLPQNTVPCFHQLAWDFKTRKCYSIL